ncbi:MAG: hypothetical protein MJZ17_05365 [Bacteroidales bacterium]|nr:hypothetical protein [Bacteroidales bacterium]
MSIPCKMDPMATNAEPWPDPPASTVDYAEVNDVNVTSALPGMYLLNHQVVFDLNFPWYGTLQWTHVVIPKLYFSKGHTYNDLYVGLLKPDAVEPYTTDKFMFLAEDTVSGSGLQTNVVCKSYIHTDPMPCGPSYGTTTAFDDYRTNPKISQITAFSRNADGTYSKVTTMSTLSDTTISSNFIAGTAAENLVTDAPDNRQHVLIRATKYPRVATALGAKFKFTPDPTRN